MCIFRPFIPVLLLLAASSSYSANGLPTYQGASPTSNSFPAKTRLSEKLIENLESSIVDSFSQQRCDQVSALSSKVTPAQLHPSVIAVIAYCEKNEKRAESLFEGAEKLAPDSEVIALLHAHHVWQLSPEKAEQLWHKVIFLARSPGIKSMAQDYLDGNVESGEQISMLQPWTYFADTSLSYGHEANVAQGSLSDGPTASGFYGVNLDASAKKTNQYGDIGVGYSLQDYKYPSANAFSLLLNNIEVPVTLRGDTQNDFVITPYGTYSTLGNSPFQIAYGLSVGGVAYRGAVKHSLTGSFFRDRYFQGIYSAEGGNHFRFEYQWDFFQSYWFLKALVSVEHVLADSDSVPDDNTNDSTNAVITYSHTDLGFQGNLERDFKLFSIGFVPKAILREDSDPSTYASSSKAIISKRRQDLQLVLQPNVTVPLDVGIKLYFWYEWNRTYSNMSVGDYLDRNIFNQTLGLSFRAQINSY